MFKHILVPVDGSESSRLAAGKAVGLAGAFGSVVTLIYVIDPYPFSGVGSDFSAGQSTYLSAATAVANEVIASSRATFEAAGIAPRTQVVESHAIWRGILEAAQVDGADLIVMGSHGRTALEKLVLGSVAQRVVAHAHLPVLVVRG